MSELNSGPASLHVEVEGEGDPVIVLAHGLTNSCRELAPLTPMFSGTKVRFCFRGHGHSSSPERGYSFADLADDLSLVADTYDAEFAVGTSMGAGALCNLLAEDPKRFRKLVILLPAGVDQSFRHHEKLLHLAALMEGKTKEEAIEAILSDPERQANYRDSPWLRPFDEAMLQGLNPVGVPRAIREIIEDTPVTDGEALRKIEAPTLLIAREGDIIHPAEVGRQLNELIPNSELMMFGDGAEMYNALPAIVMRVKAFLEG
jgi:pimeloyl-ACP methyl ester carboxylesterase